MSEHTVAPLHAFDTLSQLQPLMLTQLNSEPAPAQAFPMPLQDARYVHFTELVQALMPRSEHPVGVPSHLPGRQAPASHIQPSSHCAPSTHDVRHALPSHLKPAHWP